MRFRHEKARKTTAKRTVSFLLMLCLLLPMIPSSMGLEAKADDDTTTSSGTVTIKLHDLYIDRKEALPDGTNLGTNKDNPNACLDAYKKARSITVEKGTTLEEAFEKFKGDKNLQLGTKSLKDTGVYKLDTEDDKAMTSEINASQCVWYTRDGENGGVDGNNPREKFDATTKITGDVDLYTYSYRLRLVTGDKEYKDLIVREGQTSGFIAGNRDKVQDISAFLNANSVDNKWTDVNLGTTLTNTTQFDNGITQNYTLRQSENSQNTTTLTYYAAVDGEWKAVKTDSAFDLDRVDVWGKTGPALNYYVTDDELEEVYKAQYGFEKSMFEGGTITKQKNGYFPYSNGTGTNLYIRQMPKYETANNTTQFRVPLIEDTPSTQINEGGLAIYYTPHNTTEYDSRFLDGTKDRNGWASPNDSAVLKENSFYTVSVDDADKTQFDSSTTLPNKDEYHLYGSKVEFTLPLTNTSGNTVKWYVEKGGDNVTIDEKTGKVTVTAIDKQLVLTTDASKEYADDVQVHCFVLVNGKSQEIGKLHTSATQFNDSWGSGENQTRYYVTAEQAETVFGEFGFKASEFDPTQESQKYIFANTTYGKSTSDKIWTDAVPAKIDDVCKIPLAKSTEFKDVSGSKDLSLYYIPKNKQKTTTEGINVTADTLKTSTFYSISTDVGETKFSNLPETKYVLNGTSTTIDLPSKDANGNTVTWYPEKGSDILTIVKKDDDTTTVSITNIDKEVVLTTDASKQDADAIKVHCYVLIDGQPVEVGLVTTKKSESGWNDTKETRYYVTAKQVETVFGKYGFQASEFNPDSNVDQKYIFANAISKTVDQWNNPAKIWADVAAQDLDKDGVVKIALVNKSNGDNNNGNYKNVNLYYIPNNRAKTGYGIADLTVSDDKKITKDTPFLSANSSFSVTAKDEAGKFSDKTWPKTQYVWSGDNATVTLPYSKDATWTAWYCSMDGTLTPVQKALVGVEERVNTENNTITFTFSKVSDPILITTGTYTVTPFKLTAYVALNGVWTVVKTNFEGLQTNHTANGKYYITANELEYIYGKYGFKSSDWNLEDGGENTRIFGCEANGGTSAIWANNVPTKQGDSWYLSLVPTDKKTAEVYYLPNNTTIDKFDGKTSRTQAAKDNAIYEISISDDANQFDGYTDTQYAVIGKNKTITLQYDENVNWYIDSDGSTKKITPTAVSDDGKHATYTFENVSSSIKLTTDGLADDEVAVAGYISVNGKWTKVSSTLQKISTDQTDNNNDRYYLTSAQLESLFGSYGFKAENYKDTTADNLSKYFPSSTIGAENISTNAGGKNENGSWQVNTIEVSEENRVAGIAVYYVPNITHVTENSFAKTDTNVLEDNQFYAISFEDSTGKLSNVPSTMYLRGGQVTITVPYTDGVTWKVLGTAPNKNNTETALYVKQEVSGDSAELTFNLHSNVTVTTKEITDRNEIKLEAYVSIDNKWTLVENTGISRANWYEKDSLYYITEQELLDIYKTYGFEGLKDNTYHFGITTLYSKDGKKYEYSTLQASRMWADKTLKTDAAGNRFLPLVTKDFDKNCVDDDDDKGNPNVIRLYYMPNNKKKTPNSGVSTADGADSAKNNAFYSITFEDPNGKFEKSELPENMQVLSGTGTTIELPYKDGVTWKVTDKDGALVPLEQEKTADGKVKITVPSISYPLIVTTEEAASVNLSDKDVAVNAYVSIDDTWVPVRTEWQYTDGKFVGGSDSFFIEKLQTTKDSRYYLTVAQLEELFGKQYGFSANSFTTSSKNCFPHSTIRYKDSSSNSIYGDTEPVQINGTWCIPFINTGDKDLGISIYYTPKTTGTTKSWLKTDSKLLSDNCFSYSMSAADPLGLGGDMTLPQAKYFDKGTSATFTVPKAPDDAKWVAIDKNTGVTISDTNLKLETNNKDGSITYSIDKITQPIQFILTDGQVIVQYTANLEYSDREPLGNLFREVSKQNIIKDGTVNNQATYADTVTDSSTYTVLSPDSDRVKVRATESFGSEKRAEPRDYYYTFQGWQVEGTDNIIKPGELLTEALGKNLAVVKLHAKWEALDDQKRPNTVNFYLSTACEIMDNMSNGFAGQAKSAFTTTIYSTRIYGTNGLTIDSSQTADNSDFQILAPADTASTAYRTDTTLRNSVNTAFTSAAITSNNKLLLESFPTDEEILESLKERIKNGDEGAKTTVTMDGQEISADELTTTNFAVRWYVLKYHNSDAWHIDGVLVAKQARAVVTKTFAGDEDAIEAVKESGYSISVTHNHKQGEDDHTDYILSLNPDYQELRQGYVGYTRYDEDTDTYTWVLTARQNREYTLTEHNYKPPDSTDGNSVKYDGTYHYMIENSDTGNTTDWKTYPEDGIQLTAQAYPEDAPEDSYQRVSFRNIYVRDGLLTVMKADAATGRGLGKVQFRISRVDGEKINVYRKYTMIGKDKVYQNQYAVRKADEDSVSGGEKDADNLYEQVTNNILETDGTGLFQVYLPVDSDSTSGDRSAKYYLEETLPLGYDGPTKLEVKVSDNGKIEQITKVVEPTEALPDGKKWITGENTAILTINNYSKILTTVTAQKQWDNTVPVDERKSVKVELWRNDVKMTDTANTLYTQTLNADNNWSYTWNNLPLFVDGEIADYQLREVQINDTKYDLEAGSNGYKDYVVSYDATKYLQHLDGEKNLSTLNPLSEINLAKWNSDEASTTPYWGEDSNRTYAQHALLVVRNSKKPADILFTKTDGLGSPLQGALFGMYSDAECKHLLSQSKSDANGQVQFVSRDGDMYIKEISAPEGCTLDETVYKVEAVGDKKVLKKVSDTDGTSSTVDTIANLSHINLLIQKVDNNGNALTGAEFKIEKLNTKTNTYEPFGQGTYTVNKTDGIVQITDDNGARLNFDEGKYRIKETETPGKLYRNAGSIIVTVQGGQVYYEKAESDTDIDSWKMEQRENTVIYTLQVVNTPWYALPSTGGGNSYAALAVALGAAIMCGAAALAFWLRKRRSSEENNPNINT